MDLKNEILPRVISAAKSAGSFIREESGAFKREVVEEKKRFSDLVSYVDKTAEQQLVSELKGVLPNAGFIAEEGTGEQKDGLNWIIDPLDGTTNFIHGLPVYAVSLALFDGEEIILGVVYEVTRDECFYAVKDHGAWMNEQPIRVSEVESLKGSLLATGFPYYEFASMDSYLEILAKLMRSTHGLRRMGSAAVDLVYTACGRFEGFFEFNLNAWDIAAGALIVKEAGGTVTNFSGGEDFLFNREIIAAGPVHQELQRTIMKFWVATQ